MRVSIFDEAGDFAEDKDVAARIREDRIKPALDSRQEVVLDFTDVELSTQSFVHALTSEVLRVHGEESLRYLVFKGCNPGISGLVETVVQYSLDSLEE